MWFVFLSILFLAALTIGVCVFFFILFRNALYNSERRLVMTILRGEMTGLQLIDASEHALGLGVYHTLRRMEREGYLVSRVDYLNTEARNGRPRVYYRRPDEPVTSGPFTFYSKRFSAAEQEEAERLHREMAARG